MGAAWVSAGWKASSPPVAASRVWPLAGEHAAREGAGRPLILRHEDGFRSALRAYRRRGRTERLGPLLHLGQMHLERGPALTSSYPRARSSRTIKAASIRHICHEQDPQRHHHRGGGSFSTSQ
jgi:hypothetical protein